MKFALGGGAAERGANVLLGVREIGERYLQRGANFKLLDVTEQLRDDLLVLPVAPLGNVCLRNGFETH
jgi:hypothetical protein